MFSKQNKSRSRNCFSTKSETDLGLPHKGGPKVDLTLQVFGFVVLGGLADSQRKTQFVEVASLQNHKPTEKP